LFNARDVAAQDGSFRQHAIAEIKIDRGGLQQTEAAVHPTPKLHLKVGGRFTRREQRTLLRIFVEPAFAVLNRVDPIQDCCGRAKKKKVAVEEEKPAGARKM